MNRKIVAGIVASVLAIVLQSAAMAGPPPAVTLDIAVVSPSGCLTDTYEQDGILPGQELNKDIMDALFFVVEQRAAGCLDAHIVVYVEPTTK